MLIITMKVLKDKMQFRCNTVFSVLLSSDISVLKIKSDD
jgi:hypothetical protein